MFTRVVLLCVGIGMISSNAFGQPVTRAEFDQLVQTVQQVNANVVQMQQDTKARLDQLREEVASVTDIQAEDRAQLAQLAKKDKNGRSYVRIDASHEPTRLELQHAVASTVPETGNVILVNEMGRDQLIAVNGTTYEVIAGTDRKVPVPIGAFHIRLPGQQTEIRYVFPYRDAKIRIYPQEIASNTIRWITEPIYYSYY